LARSRLGAAAEIPIADADLAVIAAMLPSTQPRGLHKQLPGLTGGEGTPDASFGGYELVNGSLRPGDAKEHQWWASARTIRAGVPDGLRRRSQKSLGPKRGANDGTWSTAAGNEPIEALADASYSGEPDFARIENAVKAEFEPGFSTLRRATGHPAAPVMAESTVTIFKARLAAVRRSQVRTRSCGQPAMS
jgi:hypothetical protein